MSRTHVAGRKIEAPRTVSCWCHTCQRPFDEYADIAEQFACQECHECMHAAHEQFVADMEARGITVYPGRTPAAG